MGHLPSFPSCLDWLPDGRLLLVSAYDGLLLRVEPDGCTVVHADLTALSGHGWNDIVVDGRGNAYVGDIGFDFPGGDFAPGILALVTPDGAARQGADGVALPNGVAMTPDNSTLILAESYANKLTAFDVDADGAVWYGDVPNKRCVRVREGGEVLQTIDLDRGCIACMLGGPDRRTLFLMATEWRGTEGMADGTRAGQVLTAPAPAPGAGWP
jgi:sugar lactone lactonase YvrE